MLQQNNKVRPLLKIFVLDDRNELM